LILKTEFDILGFQKRYASLERWAEKAKIILIKSVDESVLKIPQQPSNRKFRKTPLQMPTFIASDLQKQIDPEMRSDAS
jgi:hypothetical protein